MSEAAQATDERRKKKRPTWVIILVIGLLLLIPMTALLLGIAVPVYRNKIINSNETSALQTIRSIAVAQENFLAANGRYGTFDELISVGALDARLSGNAPVSNGYVFTMTLATPDVNQPSVFSINADPQPGEYFSPTGLRHFYFASNVSGIRVNDERPANATDRPRT
ncbi:MAG TPA: hypothetical protein VF666_03750 [Pyrinomonadaceae bacterium]|jgi:Tfp pilus assembly protein PilE